KIESTCAVCMQPLSSFESNQIVKLKCCNSYICHKDAREIAEQNNCPCCNKILAFKQEISSYDRRSAGQAFHNTIEYCSERPWACDKSPTIKLLHLFEFAHWAGAPDEITILLAKKCHELIEKILEVSPGYLQKIEGLLDQNLSVGAYLKYYTPDLYENKRL